jgi:adenine-specific DNA-methyltransferase
VACITWHKTYSTRNDAQEFSKSHEYLLVYKRSIWNRKLLPRSEKNNEMYKHNDEDGRGPYRTDNLTAARPGNDPQPLINPKTSKEYFPPIGRSWGYSAEKLLQLLSEGRIYWGKNGEGAPQLKRYLSEVQDGVIPTTIWHYDEVGHTDKAAKEVNDLVGGGVFDYPKPLDLLGRIIQLGMSDNDIVLDFFAGSGTTGHASLLANSLDSGKRKFILVNIGEPTDEASIAFQQGYKKVSDITLGRVRAAIEKIPDSKSQGLKILSLSKSNFHVSTQSQGDIPQLFESTLDSDVAEANIVQELLLKLGERLDAVTERVTFGKRTAVRCGTTLLVPSLDIDENLVQAAITAATGVVVFLEDAFAGKDALKANAFFSAKSSNKILKTF